MGTMPADDAPAVKPIPLGSDGYWYADVPRPAETGATAVDVLRAVRRFRAADVAMRIRARLDMDMNESDLVALRHLIAAEERSESIGPKDLSVFLGITSAATAKLLTRLESAGRLRREPHPSDRRAQVLHATRRAQDEIRRVMGDAHRRMLAAAEKLSPAEQVAVVRFLDELSGAMDAPVPPASGTTATAAATPPPASAEPPGE